MLYDNDPVDYGEDLTFVKEYKDYIIAQDVTCSDSLCFYVYDFTDFAYLSQWYCPPMCRCVSVVGCEQYIDAIFSD